MATQEKGGSTGPPLFLSYPDYALRGRLIFALFAPEIPLGQHRKVRVLPDPVHGVFLVQAQRFVYIAPFLVLACAGDKFQVDVNIGHRVQIPVAVSDPVPAGRARLQILQEALVQGIGLLVEGEDAARIASRLRGTRCGFKRTSCPDQLATAIDNALGADK